MCGGLPCEPTDASAMNCTKLSLDGGAVKVKQPRGRGLAAAPGS